MERVEIIKEKLHLLEKWDVSLNVLGVATPRHTVLSCVSEEQLKQFEQKHGVSLPEEFGLFLTKVCNGLAGPEHGLRSLEQSFIHSSLRDDFPHSKHWNMPGPASDLDIDHEKYAEDYYADHLVNGTLEICSAGCYELLLIVSGPQKGEIWCDDRGSDNGIYPIATSFFDWYENWLDSSLKKFPEFLITLPSFAN